MAKRYQRGNQKPYIEEEEEETTQWPKDTKEGNLFGIFWSLCCLFFSFYVWLLITSLVSFGHCVISSSSMYGF
jgi:hypothetical protein